MLELGLGNNCPISNVVNVIRLLLKLDGFMKLFLFSKAFYIPIPSPKFQAAMHCLLPLSM